MYGNNEECDCISTYHNMLYMIRNLRVEDW